MSMSSERSRSLHNFALPNLKWGNQRFLRCAKGTGKSSADSSVTDRRSFSSETQSNHLGRRRTSTFSAAASHHHHHRRRSFASSKKSSSSSLLNPMKIGSRKVINDLSDTNGIKEVREKLINDLQIAADQMKLSLFQESILAAKPKEWNLRPRSRPPVLTPPPPEKPTAKTSNPTRFKGPAANTRTKRNIEPKEEPKVKFSIALSREEIKNDFLAITGHQPPRRPKKRPKTVQNHLNSIFPGLWLTEITREDYNVPDTTVSGKVQTQVQE